MRTTITIAILFTLNILSTEAFQIPFLIKSNRWPSSSTFQIQHAIHIGTNRNPGLHAWRNFTDSDREQIDIRSLSTEQEFYSSAHRLSITRGKIWTHRSNSTEWMRARQNQLWIDRGRGKNSSLPGMGGAAHLDWKQLEIAMPDVTDIETLANLAKMSNNAYTLPEDDRWYDHKGHWNLSHSFGWQNDGLRGHVFASLDNSTIIISIKGTSASILGNGGPTTAHDKINDNLLFSCCCARVSWSWTTVCDCYDGPGRCRKACVENAVVDRSAYFMAGVEIYNDVVSMYPNSQIWLSGHSLGGALAALLGVTFGVPVVGFEAPGDLLAAKRLHLPLPPGASFGNGEEKSAVTHVFHTADPIAMGVCNGPLSTCSIAGYALETRCHLGKVILFDTVGELNWAVDVRTHPIRAVIKRVLIPDWKKHPDCESSTVPSSGWRSIRWPWSGDKDDGKNNTNCPHPEPIVPVAQPQTCAEGECTDWDFRDAWDDDS